MGHDWNPVSVEPSKGNTPPVFAAAFVKLIGISAKVQLLVVFDSAMSDKDDTAFEDGVAVEGNPLMLVMGRTTPGVGDIGRDTAQPVVSQDDTWYNLSFAEIGLEQFADFEHLLGLFQHGWNSFS
ncbi:hypothetical protein P175DRAFT_0532644 [Aspergillus ochraceoroseus IBT 24754]|uniref:Uncharacterized protein n=1 Tax=Aspergillus ochraceoroseus IBT 24754 TaxID=1392256 RepID=A0A2T5LYA4_9EURO|nr:uncharacterized protein P175DRAFT_0532644 [Aspergillus ochraceoroseus IBT 24754]PTU21262.1 hypothetical protein P175DRAFT_0532644 [Aspergillus ochraceoroseus IBT 24754]